MAERIQKVIASAGIASRRRAEEMISRGEVTVNGQPAHLGQLIEPEDRIEVNGRAVGEHSPLVYLALNKPQGYVTSARSTHGERTIFDLVQVPERLFPVGRLDKDTSGLLLLTNDGDWANLVTHPRYQIQKEYLATVRGDPSSDQIRRLRSGVELRPGDVTAPAVVRKVGGTSREAAIDITVVEGKKRQIRLMLAAVGHPVIKLTRVRVGNIQLGDLPMGQWRRLTPEEVEGIRELARDRTGSA